MFEEPFKLDIHWVTKKLKIYIIHVRCTALNRVRVYRPILYLDAVYVHVLKFLYIIIFIHHSYSLMYKYRTIYTFT